MEVTKDIICPNCGEHQKYKLHIGINGSTQPELKRLVLEETLFDWHCKKCNYFAAMTYPFVYSDPDLEFVICLELVPETNVIVPVEEMQSYQKRMVKNPAELKEKILIFDQGYDDVAVELVKTALCDIVRKIYETKRVHAYFCRENEGELEFAIFLPGKDEAVYHSTKLEVYQQSLDLMKSMKLGKPADFTWVDTKLARKILQMYQKI